MAKQSASVYFNRADSDFLNPMTPPKPLAPFLTSPLPPSFSAPLPLPKIPDVKLTPPSLLKPPSDPIGRLVELGAFNFDGPRFDPKLHGTPETYIQSIISERNWMYYVLPFVDLVDSMEIDGEGFPVNPFHQIDEITGCRYREMLPDAEIERLRKLSPAEQIKQGCTVMIPNGTTAKVKLKVGPLEGVPPEITRKYGTSGVQQFDVHYVTPAGRRMYNKTFPDLIADVQGFLFDQGAQNKNAHFGEKGKYLPGGISLKLNTSLVNIEMTQDWLKSLSNTFDDSELYQKAGVNQYRIPQMSRAFFEFIFNASAGNPSIKDPNFQLRANPEKPLIPIISWGKPNQISGKIRLHPGTLPLPGGIGTITLANNPADPTSGLLELKANKTETTFRWKKPNLSNTDLNLGNYKLKVTNGSAEELVISMPPLPILLKKIDEGTFSPNDVKLTVVGFKSNDLTFTDSSVGFETNITKASLAKIEITGLNKLKMEGLEAERLSFKHPYSGFNITILEPKISLMRGDRSASKTHLSLSDIQSSGTIDYTPSDKVNPGVSFKTAGASKVASIDFHQQIIGNGMTEVGLTTVLKEGTIDSLSVYQGPSARTEFKDITLGGENTLRTILRFKDLPPKRTWVEMGFEKMKSGHVSIPFPSTRRFSSSPLHFLSKPDESKPGFTPSLNTSQDSGLSLLSSGSSNPEKKENSERQLIGLRYEWVGNIKNAKMNGEIGPVVFMPSLFKDTTIEIRHMDKEDPESFPTIDVSGIVDLNFKIKGSDEASGFKGLDEPLPFINVRSIDPNTLIAENFHIFGKGELHTTPESIVFNSEDNNPFRSEVALQNILFEYAPPNSKSDEAIRGKLNKIVLGFDMKKLISRWGKSQPSSEPSLQEIDIRHLAVKDVDFDILSSKSSAQTPLKLILSILAEASSNPNKKSDVVFGKVHSSGQKLTLEDFRLDLFGNGSNEIHYDRSNGSIIFDPNAKNLLTFFGEGFFRAKYNSGKVKFESKPVDR